jgi:hypothetical protein
MNLKFYFSIFLVLVFGISSLAAESKRHWYVLSLESLIGTGSSFASSDSTKANVGFFSAGVNLGLRYRAFSFGLEPEIEILTQFSEVVPSVGNRRGQISVPSALFLQGSFAKIDVKLNIMSGLKYQLENNDLLDRKVIFSKGSGFRASLSFPMFGQNRFSSLSRICLWGQSVQFTESSTAGLLTQPLQNQFFGVGLIYGAL